MVGTITLPEGAYAVAYREYRPVVEVICVRGAREREVRHLLDHLLDFGGDACIQELYQQVCQRFYFSYPEMVADHLCLWHEIYGA